MKRPRYFCEHCGAEVARETSVCPVCGRFFSSVKCPRCGFTGEPARFKKGCPICGYSVASSEQAGAGKEERQPPSGPLPVWVYLVTLTALIAAIIVFFLAVR